MHSQCGQIRVVKQRHTFLKKGFITGIQARSTTECSWLLLEITFCSSFFQPIVPSLLNILMELSSETRMGWVELVSGRYSERSKI
jgi:hypothetical protein